MGFGIWLAHYAFHFLSGFWTFVPVLQSFVADIAGVALLGEPLWRLGPLLPMGWLYPVEIGQAIPAKKVSRALLYPRVVPQKRPAHRTSWGIDNINKRA